MTVTHIPQGINPYEMQGTERVPYYPIEGEDIKVGIAIEGDCAAELNICVNKVKHTILKGSFVKEESGKKYYKFDLGKFQANDEVTYSINGAEKEYSWTFGVCKIRQLNNVKCLSTSNNQVRLTIDDTDIDMYLRFSNDSLILSGKEDSDEVDNWTDVELDRYTYKNPNNKAKVDISRHPFSMDITDKDGNIVTTNLDFKVKQYREKALEITFTYITECSSVYGLGERYNHVNHKGAKVDCTIFDKFTKQDKATYFPVPMYHTDNGHGVLIDTLCQTYYDFGSEINNTFKIDVRTDKNGSLPDVHIFFGTPKEILQSYNKLTGSPKLPPQWTFGVWASANRWNHQKYVEQQLEYLEKYDYPTSVIVIEAWSDESTFYIWNDAKYNAIDGSGKMSLEDFTFPEDGRWPDPKGMIDKLHEKGIRLVLWQIPVLREHEHFNRQHENDRQHAIHKSLCIKTTDGEPYQTPNPWFCRSILPDFTNEETRKWWFGKREYLLEMGVDGFKTDGGEVIFHDDLKFDNGACGREMKNGFAASYLEAYDEFIGENRVLFSRAGYISTKGHPMHWAGDQLSTWEELRSVLKAGLSLGLTGVPYWSFDIAGFASVLPTADLYIRATQMAAFTPVMQWHSDMVNGQFNDMVPSAGGINDRSPWNIAQFYNDDSIIDISCYYSNLHMNLHPYIYQIAKNSAEQSCPMMRHLYYDYSDDKNVVDIEDQFMFGDLLVAPIMYEGDMTRSVYLPKDEWMDIFTGKKYNGEQRVDVKAEINEIPVFIRTGSAMALNLNDEFHFGGSVGNMTDGYMNLSVFISGDNGEYTFCDAGVEIKLRWADGSVSSNNNKEYYIISKDKLDKMKECDIISFGNYEAYLYNIK